MACGPASPEGGGGVVVSERLSRHGLVSHTVLESPASLVGWGLLVAGVGLWVVGWLLVENCTVDASILFSVVKLSRANGGCLGTRSR